MSDERKREISSVLSNFYQNWQHASALSYVSSLSFDEEEYARQEMRDLDRYSPGGHVSMSRAGETVAQSKARVEARAQERFDKLVTAMQEASYVLPNFAASVDRVIEGLAKAYDVFAKLDSFPPFFDKVSPPRYFIGSSMNNTLTPLPGVRDVQFNLGPALHIDKP